MEECIDEKLLDNYPSYVSIEQTKIILAQLENSICKIYTNDEGQGTGFFCNIKYKNSNKSLFALITNNHVLDENNIKPNKVFKISYNLNKKLEYRDIKIGNKRLVYTNKKYDTTIIELTDEKYDIEQFLELDQRIFQDNSNLLYLGKSAYALHFPGNKPVSVSFSVLKRSEKSNYKMIHYCSTEKGSSGGPILSLSEMKVIGIHKGAATFSNYNLGFFLKYPIEELFLNSFQSKNEIILKSNVEKSDVQSPINLLDKYNNDLNQPFYENSKESNKSNKLKQEGQKSLESINESKIQNKINNLKKNLGKLFDELFENEKIESKINNKLIITMQSSVKIKELEIMNFIVIGRSGVGKSTLINEIFGEKIAKEGRGIRTTIENKKYESKLVPFLSVIDTPGNESNESGSTQKLIDVLQETLQHIDEKLNSNDLNEYIHCILYCIDGRSNPDELDVIIKLREKYDGKKLPIVIVFTRATNDDEVNCSRNSIKDFLGKYGETLSNDIFGISFIPVNVRQDEIRMFDRKILFPSFGLSTLITTCFEKVETSYRILIKNTLIQIEKNKIKEYINNISKQLENNLNYYFYLSEKFEPHFANYISYCFDKITDVEKQKGINNDEMKNLQDYINDRKMEHLEIKNEITENLCSTCSQKTDGPYICEFCKALYCEKCYLIQFSKNDVPRCSLCDQELKENKLNKKNQDKNINYMNILKTDLNLKSKNSIHNYIKEFKNYLNDEVIEKYGSFIKDEAKKFYIKVSEKCNQNISNAQNSSKLKENMKKTIKSEVSERLTNILKNMVIEYFINKSAAENYQLVVEIFKTKLNSHLDEYFKNLEKNKEANKVFEYCDITIDNKIKKLKEKMNKYIKELQKKEEKSTEESLILAYSQGNI